MTSGTVVIVGSDSSRIFPLETPQLQIQVPVVVSDPIFMMNAFTREQKPTEPLLYDETMFRHVSGFRSVGMVRRLNQHITIGSATLSRSALSPCRSRTMTANIRRRMTFESSVLRRGQVDDIRFISAPTLTPSRRDQFGGSDHIASKPTLMTRHKHRSTISVPRPIRDRYSTPTFTGNRIRSRFFFGSTSVVDALACHYSESTPRGW